MLHPVVSWLRHFPRPAAHIVGPRLTSCLPARKQDVRVHKVLADKLDASLLRARLVIVFDNFKEANTREKSSAAALLRRKLQAAALAGVSMGDRTRVELLAAASAAAGGTQKVAASWWRCTCCRRRKARSPAEIERASAERITVIFPASEAKRSPCDEAALGMSFEDEMQPDRVGCCSTPSLGFHAPCVLKHQSVIFSHAVCR